MNAEDVNKLPRYIEAPGGGMWGPMPDGFTIANKDGIFIKLVDVEALFHQTVTMHERTAVQDGVEYVSVGYGGTYLVDMAERYGWNLCTRNVAGQMSSGWRGNTEGFEYFIKKETNA